ncbi:hypothetical protein R3P38DRAFT_2856048 [Favolaschia claudopus]|uniref:Uncharacterized protein n=1 Tax=Favolaschia claudopus TaxID=2862362 RepID=A0AAW0DSN1_9AGAR
MLWSTSVEILSANNLRDPERTIEFLRVMMLHHPEDREVILKEMVLRLINSERQRDALDELELYLPSFPYQDNALLHLYAGLLSLYLGQPTSNTAQFNPTLLRSAQTYFERAKTLDPQNAMAEAFIRRIHKINGVDIHSTENEESDEETPSVVSDKPKRKRVRRVND